MKTDPATKKELFRFHGPIFSSFLVVSGLFIFESVFFTPFFHVNDDHWALFISKGAGIGLQPDEHLLYNNVILGFLLKTLYGIFPKGHWYAGLLVLAQFLGFWAVLAGALMKSGGKISYWLFATAFLLVGLYYFQQLNYTMTAALAFQGGLFLLPSLLGEGKPLTANPFSCSPPPALSLPAYFALRNFYSVF